MNGERVTVFHLIDTLNMGGAEKLLTYLLPGLPVGRYRVLVGTVTDTGPLEEEIESAGIPVIHVNARGRRDLTILLRLCQIFRQENVTILHTHLFVDSFWGRIAAVLSGVPIRVVTQHNSYEGGNLPPKWQVWADRLLWHVTDRIVAVSEGARKFLLEDVGVPAEKIRLIPNAIAPLPDVSEEETASLRRELGLERAWPVLGTVARLTPQKGLSYLIRAVAILRKQFPRVKCLIVGDGELKSELSDLVSKMDLGSVVLFTGIRRDVPAILSTLDLFVLPSIFEGMPVALLEAMEAGLPVVATHVTGVTEVVEDGANGVLVPPGNPPALAEGVAALVADPEELSRLGGAARATIASRYSLKPWVERYRALYEDLLAAHRAM